MAIVARDLFGQTVPEQGRKRQLALPLGWVNHDATDSTPFLLGPSNREAFDHLAAYADWITPVAILAGPRGSGRSLLARLFEEGSGGRVIDLAEAPDEETIFHAWNNATETGQRLLIVTTDDWSSGDVKLPDLQTRLAALSIARIAEPDAVLASQLIETLLSKASVAFAPGIGDFVVHRIDRSYAALHKAVDSIVAHANEGHRSVTTHLAREALIAAELWRVDGNKAGDAA